MNTDSRGKYESIARFPTKISQKKMLRKLQGSIQDNKEDHSNLDNAVYHEQCYAVDNQQHQGPEGPDKVISG